ncbi:MAG TPA: branched-chain amino acid transaminase [Gemmatimonadaceae bacterium]|nr:branched-chain amino acid transaminase [Gemmatimonadaceae bacterium]
MYTLTETAWIWRNGSFIKWADAHVHVLSHSMQFGSSAFEGIRCYSTPRGPAIFRLEDHLQRLVNSCRVYRMELPYTIDELVAACCELVERNQLDACYLRPMVIRGYGAAGMVPHASPIEVYLPCWPWGAYLGEGALENGVDACISSWHRMAPNTIPSMAKVAGNYLSGQLIKMEALANGFAEAIALGPDGMVSEGSGQNVFLVHRGTLHTPPVNGTLLAGITRDSIVALARDAGIAVQEQPMPREMLYGADEVFLTGTASEVTPVRSIDKITIGKGRRGPITQRLQQRFLDVARGAVDDTHGWLTHVRAERAATRSEARDPS